MKATYGAALSGLAMAGMIAACAPQMSDQVQARNDFAALCVDCHGADGRGGVGDTEERADTVGRGQPGLGLGLGPELRLQLLRPVGEGERASNGGVFPRLQVMGHIYGFTPGRSESPMPEFGDLLDGPTVPYDAGDGNPTPTPARLVALMEYVEAMQR